MFEKTKLATCVCAAVAATSLPMASVANAAEGEGIELIQITATKRTTNIQEVPVTVQALNEEMLDNQDINTFSDYVAKLPNVAFAGRGPGQNDVYIRGVAAAKGSLFQAGGIGAGPTVAFYVDDQPLTAAGRNIDVYVTDMERIEVLPGPQGTLYGASSQAGTVRMITNKPDTESFSFAAEASLSTTQGGELSEGIEGYINIPIIEEKLGVRATFYKINNGGYIDNVEGNISFAQYQEVPGGGVIVNREDDIYHVSNNADLVEDDFNDSTYTGGRIAAKLQLSEDWSITAGYMTQQLDVDGVFDYNPNLGDLKVQRYNKDVLKDEFDQFNWTLEGRLANLDVIYTGSYLEREVEQMIDYTHYTLGGRQGAFQPWYNCTYNAIDWGARPREYDVIECKAPSQYYVGYQESENWNHELRFATDDTKDLKFIGGFFYDESESGVSQNWAYHDPALFAPNAPHSEADVYYNPNVRDEDIAFFNDLINESEQFAIFGELTYDFSDDWSATVGYRRYDIDIHVGGSFNFASYGDVDGDGGGTLNDVAPENESGDTIKLTVNHQFNKDVLFYATYSEGFRRGGFNRQGDVFDFDGNFQYPGFYGSDFIDNYEFGWKTYLLDGTLKFNGSIYRVDWSNMQIDIFDQSINNLLFTANAGEAEITGVEGDFTYLVAENVTLTGAFSYNDTELTDRPEGADNLLPVGSDLPLTPTFQGNLNARYDFMLSGFESYAQIGARYRGDVHTSLVALESEQLDSYVVMDASFGLDLDEWQVKLFINNLTNKRDQQFFSYQDNDPRVVVSRPRTVSLKVSYDFY